MSKHRRRDRPSKEKINWNNVAWSVVLANAPRWTSLPSPASLHPDEALMNAAVDKDDPVARAIINAWAFTFPVTLEVRR